MHLKQCKNSNNQPNFFGVEQILSKKKKILKHFKKKACQINDWRAFLI
jgi:hypothetical protein